MQQYVADRQWLTVSVVTVLPTVWVTGAAVPGDEGEDEPVGCCADGAGADPLGREADGPEVDGRRGPAIRRVVVLRPGAP